jgi:anti-anti-sigma regulatory factor
VVDTSRTQFCDTAGLYALVAAHKRARADGGEVVLVMPGSHVLRVFTITGLDRVIACCGDLDEALARVARGAGTAPGQPARRPRKPGRPGKVSVR